MKKITALLTMAAILLVASSCTRVIPSVATLENEDAVMRVHLPRAMMMMAGSDIAEDLGKNTKIKNMDIYAFRNGVSTGVGRKMLEDMKRRDNLEELLSVTEGNEDAIILGIPSKKGDNQYSRMLIAAFEEKEGAIVVMNGNIDLEGIVLEESGLIDHARKEKRKN